ncbi:hypothetical protein BU15DRAFT_80763 [Melanogaster broomeanus]|nr:hypothetical protein BU15DRAFT_80763 [Melanogaster broomeanus]
MDKIPLMVIEAIRSVAFLLEEDVTSRIATIVTSHISDLASKEITSHVIRAIAPHVANILTTSEALHENVEEIKKLHSSLSSNPNADDIDISIGRVEEATDAVLSSLEDVKNVVTLLNPSLEATQECINNLISKTTELPPPPPHSAEPNTATTSIIQRSD